MSEHVATPRLEMPLPLLRDTARKLTGYWWILLVAGLAWGAVSLVILQFNHASVTTVGILVGLMFLGLGIENIGFLFLIVGVWWIVRAFLERPISPLWWTGLISGILMTVVAFWTSGQFFIHKAYVLLVFAGIWALMQGVTNIGPAFEIRALREEL